jgi:hypothetical protein
MKNGYDRTLLYHDVNNAVDEQGKRENLQEPHLHHAIPPTHGCMSQRQMFRLVTDMQGTSICWLQMQKNHEKSTAKDAFFLPIWYAVLQAAVLLTHHQRKRYAWSVVPCFDSLHTHIYIYIEKALQNLVNTPVQKALGK